MMKKSECLKLRLSVIVLLVVPGVLAAQSPSLDLWMDASLGGATLEVDLYRQNDGFGLGGLSYDLQFSESLNLSREYSDYGWIASDGVFDISSPVDVGASGSVPGIFGSITFDTVADPCGSEFAAGTSGIVELLNITLDDLTPRWIYFDIVSPSASNGAGDDLVTTLQGTLNVIPDDNPDPPEQGHTLAIYVPEPGTIFLFGLGGLALMRKRKA